MSKRKELSHGQRANFYIRKDVPQEMLDWINLQSDVTNFVLYAIENLYKTTGNIDVASVLPRNHVYELSGTTEYITALDPQPTKPEPVKEPEEQQPSAWSDLADMDDPFS